MGSMDYPVSSWDVRLKEYPLKSEKDKLRTEKKSHFTTQKSKLSKHFVLSCKTR